MNNTKEQLTEKGNVKLTRDDTKRYEFIFYIKGQFMPEFAYTDTLGVEKEMEEDEYYLAIRIRDTETNTIVYEFMRKK